MVVALASLWCLRRRSSSGVGLGGPEDEGYQIGDAVDITFERGGSPVAGVVSQVSPLQVRRVLRRRRQDEHEEEWLPTTWYEFKWKEGLELWPPVGMQSASLVTLFCALVNPLSRLAQKIGVCNHQEQGVYFTLVYTQVFWQTCLLASDWNDAMQYLHSDWLCEDRFRRRWMYSRILSHPGFKVYAALVSFCGVAMSAHCHHGQLAFAFRFASATLYLMSALRRPSSFETSNMCTTTWIRCTLNPMRRRIVQLDELDGSIPRTLKHGVEAHPIDINLLQNPLRYASAGRHALPIHERLCLFFNAGWIQLNVPLAPVGEPTEGHKDHLMLGATELVSLCALLYVGCVFRVQPQFDLFVSETGMPPVHCPTRAAGDHAEVPDWITEDFLDIDTSQFKVGYECCADVKAFVKLNGWNTLSLLEILLAQGVPGIRIANHFLSHWQGETLQQTFMAMRQSALGNAFFLDICSIRQAAKQDFLPTTVEVIIRAIGSTVLLWSPTASARVLTRVWCCYEIGATVKHDDVKLHLQAIDGAGSFVQSFTARGLCRCLETFVALLASRVHLEDAEARKQSDKDIVLEHVRQGRGLRETNAAVQFRLHRAAWCLLGRSSALWLVTGICPYLLVHAVIDYHAKDSVKTFFKVIKYIALTGYFAWVSMAILVCVDGSYHYYRRLRGLLLQPPLRTSLSMVDFAVGPLLRLFMHGLSSSRIPAYYGPLIAASIRWGSYVPFFANLMFLIYCACVTVQLFQWAGFANRSASVPNSGEVTAWGRAPGLLELRRA